MNEHVARVLVDLSAPLKQAGASIEWVSGNPVLRNGEQYALVEPRGTSRQDAIDAVVRANADLRRFTAQGFV